MRPLITPRRAVLVLLAIHLAVPVAGASPVQQPVVAHCVDFDDQSLDGWNGSVTAVQLTVATPGTTGGSPDYFLRAEAVPGPSLVFAGPDFLGDYRPLVADGCAALTFDVRVYADGNATQSNDLHPSVSLTSGALTATFNCTLTMSEDLGSAPGWHRVTAPLWLATNGQLPSNIEGTWSGVTAAQWNTLLANVDNVIFWIEFSPDPGEVVGFDNVCLSPGAGCRTWLNKDVRNDTGQNGYGLEFIIAGWHPGVTQFVQGVFQPPTITQVQGNTSLRWTDGTPGPPCNAVVGTGNVVHVGFMVPVGSIEILSVAWLDCNGNYIDCVDQVTAPSSLPADPTQALYNGVVRFSNTSVQCESNTKYVRFLQIEWGAQEEPLEELVWNGVRHPFQIDLINDAPVAIQPNATYVRSIQPPPPGADFATLVYQVADTPTANPGVTDWLQMRVVRPTSGETGTVFCTGGGSGTACPCGNSSAVVDAVGCLNSLGFGGRLRATGIASLSADAVVLTGSQMPSSTCLYFQGTNRIGGGNGVVFGDGKRCAGGSVVRLKTVTNVGGASQFPLTGDLSVSVKGLIGAPGLRTYQCWYRNSAAFCVANATFNLSNGLEIAWAP